MPCYIRGAFPLQQGSSLALRKLGHSVGENVYFPADITLTQNFVKHRGKLVIGNRVSIGPKVIIILASHPNASHNRNAIPSKPQRVVIGDDAWIGAGAIILNGVTIGNNAIVGAGSVVTHDVEPFTIVAGNPARVIKRLNDNNLQTTVKS